MHVAIYSLECGSDTLIGVAHDVITGMSLVECARLKGAAGVSLHGTAFNGKTLSGEASFNEAAVLLVGEDRFIPVHAR